MMTVLDAVHTEFQRINASERYEFIARFKKYLAKQPAIKSEKSHAAFLAMIEHHITQMQTERDLLQKMLTAYLDLSLDGLSGQPIRYNDGFKYLSEKIAERIDELNYFINEYTEDLTQRIKQK